MTLGFVVTAQEVMQELEKVMMQELVHSPSQEEAWVQQKDLQQYEHVDAIFIIQARME